MSIKNPIQPFIDNSGLFVLDGALASELEVRGANLNDPLWSAKILLEQPELLEAVNHAYLMAGADMVTTATYQATFEGFSKRGLDTEDAIRLFQKAVDIAKNARSKFWEVEANRQGRIKPIISGSIGPFGAFLADGSEYSGRYDLTDEQLKDFHQKRLEVLINAGVDIVAFETFPSFREALVVLDLLKAFPEQYAIISFSCKDELHISDSTPFHQVVAAIDPYEKVAAIGVNCLPAQHVASLLGAAAAVTEKPLMAYPNSGEHWNAQDHCWEAGDTDASIHDLVELWYELGAKLIGGCCRTDPSDIRRIREKGPKVTSA
ncbi:MAG: homocysteine S-methyltransferase [Bacteroidota bacterium]